MNPTLFLLSMSVWLLIPLIFGRKKRRNNRHKRNIKTSHRLLKRLRQFQGPGKNAMILAYLKKINPYVFEELILTAISEGGTLIERSKRYSGDKGIDGSFRYRKKRYLIQAKRYRNHISKAHVLEFAALASSFAGGLFVHTGKTRQSVFKSCPKNIRIVSGSALVDLLLGQKTIQHFVGYHEVKKC